MDKERLLQRYLDGELDPEEERKALHLFADDPEMRQVLRFEQRLQSTFRKRDSEASYAVPSDFTERVMNSIKKQEETVKDHDYAEKIISWVRWFWQPRPVRLRPAYAVLVLLMTVTAGLFPFSFSGKVGGNPAVIAGESVQQISETADKVWIRFIFIDEHAEKVEVAGDFSNWKPILLNKQIVNGERVWTGLISMERGEHRYMFVKDGKEWVTDPLAPVQREDGFGNKNAVIYL